MKRLLGLFFVLLFAAIIVLPALVIKVIPAQNPQVTSSQDLGPPISVKMPDGKIQEMDLERYLVGVVAAEMPAEFHPEALKAQAVAARTYTLRRLVERRSLEDPDHPGADVCTDFSHCQAWLSEDQMKERWNILYLPNYRKVCQAVQATAGIVITYQNRLIDPVYHSTSSGRTENAVDVWGKDLPYLRSVACPWDKDSPRYLNQAAFSLGEIDRRLGTNLEAVPAASLTGKKGQPPALEVVEYTSTGRVKKIRLGEKVFTGTELREALGLTSTDLRWTISGDRITFTTVGNGHGVGLSQYGANGMAGEDKNFVDILTYYYKGVKLVKFPHLGQELLKGDN